MKYLSQTRWPSRAAFTLIELLVVIAIIGVLAALVFPALRAAKISATRGKVQMELKQLEMAIEAYKSRYGFYPPDAPGTPDLRVAPNRHALNRLFYELAGVTKRGTQFETLDGRQQISATSVEQAFGAGVKSFINCTVEGGGDDNKAAQKFLTNLKPDQFALVSLGSNVRVGFLVCSVPWPAKLGTVLDGVPEVNPWRYNASNPTHNPKSFDLWVDIEVAGKTNRISNWNRQYEVVK